MRAGHLPLTLAPCPRALASYWGSGVHTLPLICRSGGNIPHLPIAGTTAGQGMRELEEGAVGGNVALGSHEGK